MGRTRVRRRRLTVTLSVALVGAAWTGPALDALGGDPGPRLASRGSYVVRQGDTLWSIAEAISPSADPRALVDVLSTANDIDGSVLVPGQVLVIPSGP